MPVGFDALHVGRAVGVPAAGEGAAALAGLEQGRDAHADAEARERLIAEVLDDASPYRALIADYVLIEFARFSSLSLPDMVVSYLVERLQHVDLPRGDVSVLAIATTREQVELYLLPLFPNAAGLLRKNLNEVVETAGRRLRVQFQKNPTKP